MIYRIILLLLSMTSILPLSGYPGQAAFAATTGVPASRLNRLTRGVNVTRWFTAPQQQTAAYLANYLTNDDLQLIHDLGFRFVRLAIDPGALYHRETPAQLDSRMMGYVDAAIDRFLAHDLAVVVDMHSPDRGPFEKDSRYVDGFVTFWGALAAHLSTRSPDMVFLELLNEPVFQGNAYGWAPIQQRLIDAVRAKAPQHTLILTGPLWGGIDGLLKLLPVLDRNVLYTFHFYEPMTFTHQGATWAGDPYPVLRNLPYPSSPDACAGVLPTITDPKANQAAVEYCKINPWNASQIDARIAQAAHWAAVNGTHVLVGEFGVYCPVTPSDSRLRWLQDVHTSFEKYGIGWTLWGYDDCFGLGRTVNAGKITFDRGAAGALGLATVAQASQEEN